MKEKKHITFDVSLEEYNKIKTYSREMGRTTSQIIRSLLLITIDKYNESKDVK